MIDIYSREIIGHAVSDKHDTELIREALFMAYENTNSKPEIHHSDQGSEYKSQDYTEELESKNIKISMSKKASPWENGFQESYYKGFKDDLGDIRRFNSLGELVEAVHLTIDYYNSKRIHSAISMTPKDFKNEYENKFKHLNKLSSVSGC